VYGILQADLDAVVIVHGQFLAALLKSNFNYGDQAHLQTTECVVLAVLQVLLAPLHQLLLMLIQEILIRYAQDVHRVVTGIAVKASPTAAVRRTFKVQELQIYVLKVAFQEFHAVWKIYIQVTVSVDGAAFNHLSSKDLVFAKPEHGTVSIIVVHLAARFPLFLQVSSLTTVLLLLEQYTGYQQSGEAAALILIIMDIWYLHQLLDHVTQHSQIHAVVSGLVVVAVAAGAVAEQTQDIDVIRALERCTRIWWAEQCTGQAIMDEQAWYE
jgi:uncharacterized membrane protein